MNPEETGENTVKRKEN